MALRIPSFVVATTTLGVLAHVLGGGSPPPAALLTVMLAGLTVLARALAPAEQSLPRLMGTLLWVQLAVHVALASGTPLGVTVDCQVGHGGSPTAAGAGPSSLDAHSLHASPWMWACHALAALLIAVWLRRGEAACWRAVRRLAARLLPPPPSLPAVPGRPRTWVDDAEDARRDPPPALLGHRWRGPPGRSRMLPTGPLRIVAAS